MLLRATFIAGVCCLLFTVGCSTSEYGRDIDSPPEFKVQNMGRLGHELAWFYADVQDLVFGVDYYDDLENRWGKGSPYP